MILATVRPRRTGDSDDVPEAQPRPKTINLDHRDGQQTMTHDKLQPNVNDRPEQAKPEQVGQQAQKSPATAGVALGQRAVPGRKPLFRK